MSQSKCLRGKGVEGRRNKEERRACEESGKESARASGRREEKENEEKTHSRSGAKIRLVLSLKCTPTDPSLRVYPIPYLLQ